MCGLMHQSYPFFDCWQGARWCGWHCEARGTSSPTAVWGCSGLQGELSWLLRKAWVGGAWLPVNLYLRNAIGLWQLSLELQTHSGILQKAHFLHFLTKLESSSGKSCAAQLDLLEGGTWLPHRKKWPGRQFYFLNHIFSFCNSLFIWWWNIFNENLVELL